MQLGRVRGTVVATVKSEGLEGVKLLVVQPLDRDRRPAGRCVVAADAVAMAGPGEVVYYVASREAAEALEPSFVPVDHAIVGIVDAYDVTDPPVGRSAEGGENPSTPAPRVGRSAEGGETQSAEGGENPSTPAPRVGRSAEGGETQ